METWVSKVISLILIFIITLVCGLVPIKLVRVLRPNTDVSGVTSGSRGVTSGSRRRRADIIIGYLNCFSGGVFLAITMLDLLPNVREEVETVLEDLGQDSTFPVTEFISCLGFFLVMLIEHSVAQYQRGSGRASTPDENVTSLLASNQLTNSDNMTPREQELQQERAPLLGPSAAPLRDPSAKNIHHPSAFIFLPNSFTSNNLINMKLHHHEHVVPTGGKVMHQHEDRMQVVPTGGGVIHQHEDRMQVVPTGGGVIHQHEDRIQVVPTGGGVTHQHEDRMQVVPTGGGGVIHNSTYASFHNSLPLFYSSLHFVGMRSCHSRDFTRGAGNEIRTLLPTQYVAGYQRSEDWSPASRDEYTHSHGHSHGFEPAADESLHSLRSLILLIALSTHTVFEGMALGLQQTSLQVWTLFTAIILHKAIMSFTAGLRFIETLPKVRTTLFYIFIFSLTAPVGIAIGLAVSESGTSGLVKDIVSAALQGVATGTFIYVTFFEVLMEEMTKNQSIAKVFAVIVGFTCIAALSLVEALLHI